MPSNMEKYDRRKKLVYHKTDKKLTALQKIKLAIQAKKTIETIQTMQIKGSWRSSLFGAGGIATILFNVASVLLDENPTTNPDWSLVLPALMTSVALLFTKDSNVSHATHPASEAKPVK